MHTWRISARPPAAAKPKIYLASLRQCDPNHSPKYIPPTFAKLRGGGCLTLAKSTNLLAC
jgi:hypothetical protein